MAKNYADIYNNTGDSVSLEQRWYVKKEVSSGTLIAPTNTDFFYTLGGGSISYSQPIETSPHRSGRHQTGFIKKKKVTSFTLSTYFNIDESLGSPGVGEIDPAVRVLFNNVFGKEDITGGSPVYTSLTAPSFTFSIFEVGDKWARQARAGFVEGVTMDFPGNGEAKLSWTGMAADAVLIGIGKSIVANTANTVTLGTGEGGRFVPGGLVMIVKADGTTRSTDTSAARTVVSVSGDVVTLSGAPLTDADGSTTPVYLCYFEPAAPAAINNPVTGLVGSMNIASTTVDCFRHVSIALTNNHEKVDYRYGVDSLAFPFFVAGNRFMGSVTVETNLNDRILQLFNGITQFATQNLTLVLGSSSGRHLSVAMPKVIFPVPAFADPESGSIPITFVGTAEQTSLGAADEVTVSFL